MLIEARTCLEMPSLITIGRGTSNHTRANTYPIVWQARDSATTAPKLSGEDKRAALRAKTSTLVH
jgi:hypothetical protein